MTILLLGHNFVYETECVTRLFFPGEKIITRTGADCDDSDIDADIIETQVAQEDGKIVLSVRTALSGVQQTGQETLSADASEKETEITLGMLLWHVLCKQTGKRPQWGTLTGVRPVRLFNQMLERGMSQEDAYREFTQYRLVAPQKAKLTMEVAKVQQDILSRCPPQAVCVYISIPFCPSRCLYCSFISHAIDRAAKLLPEYLTLLCEEIRETGNVIKTLGLEVAAIYIGGGTPTILQPEQLTQLFTAVETYIPRQDLLEYTVEAGRPDTITEEKLAVLRLFGVDRLSVNPQTMDDGILQAIGRNHTAQQTLESFALARRMGFDNINMDLIAGLPGESEQTLADTLKQVISLSPENITLHTLTVKRSSTLRTTDNPFAPPPLDVGALVTQAQNTISAAGYTPYYLYRQKGPLENLENTGFSKSGKEGLYNVYSMEDTRTILALGAGGVTKLICPDGKIVRIGNFKYPYEYIGRFSEILKRKEEISLNLNINSING